MSYIIYISFFLFFLISCRNSNGGDESRNNKSISPKTEYRTGRKLIKKQISITSRFEKDDYLHILISEPFILSSLSHLDSPQNLSESLGMELTNEEVISNNRDSNDTIYYLRRDSSFLKLFFNKYNNEWDIVTGSIRSKEIKLDEYLNVGIAKYLLEDSFEDSIDLSKYSLIYISNELPTSIQKFIFDKNDTLMQIDFESDYDWID